MRNKIKVFFLCLALPGVTWAAGFLDHKNGVPYKWNTDTPISYKIDLVPSGAYQNGTTNGFDVLTNSAFDVWRQSPTSNIDFSESGNISENVIGPTLTGSETAQEFSDKCATQGNYKSHVVLDSTGAPRSVSADTEIIFDDDGSIIECLLGQGQSAQVLGFASAGAFDDSHMSITSGVAIMNGKDSSVSQLKATLTHEFGHMLNLQHSQLNFEEAFDNVSSKPETISNDSVVPTMFPFLLGNVTEELTLQPDDEFSLSYLYPDTAALASKATLTGKILRRNGDAVRGVHVICRNEAEPRQDAVSWISDHVLEGKGEYVCGNLTAGANYTVFIEPVFLAINFYTPDPPFIASEYYSGAKESFDPKIDIRNSSSEVREAVAVTAGNTTPDINVVLNEDGRLISGKKITGSANSFFPDLEYFITVPSSARKVVFDLKGADSSVDLDIMGRCDGEFSLPIDSTALPLTASAGSQQADFATTGTTGTESVVLNATSSPAIKGCTYHILIVNYSAVQNASSTTDFDLTATIDGGNPKVTIQDVSLQNGDGGSGELLMLTQKWKTQDDTFRLSSLTYTDSGNGDFSGVTGAKLYLDMNGDGKWSASEDRLLSSTTVIDVTGKKFTFTGMDEFFEADTTHTLFVTYEFGGAAAKMTGWAAVALFGITIGSLFGKRKWLALQLTLILLVFASCSGSPPKFSPSIASKTDVSIEGQSYGDQITIDISPGTSISDFFN